MCTDEQVFGVLQMVVSSTAISLGFGKALILLTDRQIVQASKVRLIVCGFLISSDY